MSARLASRPGRRRRSFTLGAATSASTTARTSSAVRRNRLNERGGSPPVAAWASAATAWIVPDDPTATSKPWRATSRLYGDNVAWTNRRQDDTALGCNRSPGKNRLVRRTAPSLKLREVRTSPRSPTSTSVDPPPMSHRRSRRSNTGSACRIPRWMRRASSSTRDDLDIHSGLLPSPGHELVVVLRLPNRARWPPLARGRRRCRRSGACVAAWPRRGRWRRASGTSCRRCRCRGAPSPSPG